MSQLETLSIHFISFPPRRIYLRLPPTGNRVVLPSLTCLKYRGTSKYLDSFVARIDAPRLGGGEIDIRFFNQPTIDASALGRFIERIEMQTPFSHADVKTSAHAISISLSNSNTSSESLLRLQISCQQLDWQLSCMIQVCDQISPIIFRVQNLRIDANQFPWMPGMEDSVGGEQWPELVRLFSGARNLLVTGEPIKAIVCGLSRTDDDHPTDTIVHPALRNLRVQGIMSIEQPFWDDARSSITSRWLSGYPLTLQFLCYGCNGTIFTQLQVSEHFKRSKREFQIMCSRCVSEIETITGTQYIPVTKHPEGERPEA